MSAIVVMMKAQRAFVWTDGAAYDGAGVLHAVERKCAEVAGTGMALATRGPASVEHLFVDWLAGERIQAHDVEDQGQAIFAGFIAEGFPRLGINLFRPFDLCLVGWSARRGAPFGAYADHRPGQDLGFRFIEDEIAVPTIPDDEVPRIQRAIGFGIVPYEQISPVAYGKAVMGAQRRDLGRMYESQVEAYLVGGHILQTEVTAAGVTHRIIHTWPDKIGERIDPTVREPDRLTGLVGGFGKKRRPEAVQ